MTRLLEVQQTSNISRESFPPRDMGQQQMLLFPLGMGIGPGNPPPYLGLESYPFKSSSTYKTEGKRYIHATYTTCTTSLYDQTFLRKKSFLTKAYFK